MADKYSLNITALHKAAREAGHIKRSGALKYAAISRHTGLDPSVVSRVVRDENGPDLVTVIGLARGYGLTVEELLIHRDEECAA